MSKINPERREISETREMIKFLKLYKLDSVNGSIKESIVDIESKLIKKNLSIKDIKYITERINLIALSIGITR